MDTPWRKQLQLLMKERGLAVTVLSKRAGLDRSSLSKILKGTDPTIDSFLAICKELGVSPSQILEEGESFAPSIALVGFASGGEGWTPIEGSTNDTVDFDIAQRDTIAIEVRGDSMSPVYRSGDTLICQRHYGPHLDNFIGRDCVIQTKNGDHYIKIMKRGSRPNRMTLKSYNPLVDDIEDVAVAWAAPVVWVRRG
jgi:phage repressor protein C with HTH and peptisase S24 domain